MTQASEAVDLASEMARAIETPTADTAETEQPREAALESWRETLAADKDETKD